MRSRSKLLSYVTETVNFLDYSNSETSSYFYYSRGSSASTVATVATNAVIGLLPSCYIGDIPVYQSGSYFWRDDTLVAQRIQEHLNTVIMPLWLAQCRAALPDPKPVAFLKSVHLITMNDVVNPGFRRRSLNGDIILTPMNSSQKKYTIEVRKIGEGEKATINYLGMTTASSQKRFNYKRLYENKIKGFGIPAEEESFLDTLTHFDLMDRQTAVNSAFDSVTSADFDLPVFIAEAGDTVRTIARAGYSLFRIIRSIKRFEFQHLAPTTWRKFASSGYREQADILTDAWLEARYAWRPLISDVESGINYLLNDRNENQRRTFRGFDDDTSGTTVNTIRNVDVNGYTMTNAFGMSGDILQNARAGVIVELASNLTGARGLGFTDVSGVVWELVPFSFVIDWFVNIRGILSSLNPSVGQDLRGSFASVRGSYTLNGTFNCTYRSATESGLSISLTRMLYDRSVDNKRTFTPTLDVNFDIFKVVDAAALLWKLR